MAHIHDLIDLTVGAVIVCGGKVLLVDHREVGTWLFPGGHVELNEDTDEALWREIHEETGFLPANLEIIAEKPDFTTLATTTQSLFPPRWVNIHEINDHHRHLTLFYLFRSRRENVALASQEHHAIRWLQAADCDDPSFGLFPEIRFYAREGIRLAS